MMSEYHKTSKIFWGVEGTLSGKLVGQVLTLVVHSPRQSRGRGVHYNLRMGHIRHYPGPDDLDCLLKDAAHGVRSFHRRVDTLTVVYSPRINIRPLSVLLLRMPPYAPTTRLLAPVAEAFLPSHVLFVRIL